MGLLVCCVAGDKMSIMLKPFGFASYKKKLEKLGRSVEDLDKPMDEVDKVAMGAVKSYPPYGDWESGEVSFTRTRPGSKYKRTGALGRGWRRRRTNSGKMMKLIIWHSHPASGRYFPYVAGRNQAPIHQPWWETTETWPAKLKPKLLEIFRKYMKDVTAKF